jgi:hypothetical protein
MSDVGAISAISSTGAKSNGVSSDQYAQKMAEAAIARMDKNSDGVLSKDEIGFSEEVFKLMDKDNNGKITADEMKTTISSVSQLTGSGMSLLSGVNSSGVVPNTSSLLNGSSASPDLSALMSGMNTGRPPQLGNHMHGGGNGRVTVINT